MTHMKKLLSLALTAVLVAGLFAGCVSNAEKLQQLAGTWSVTTAAVESEAEKLLKSLDAKEAELALADLGSLKITQQVIFTADGSYTFCYDVQAVRASVKAFFEGYFDDLYEGRDTLKELHQTDFADMSQEDFQAFYAEFYGLESYDALIAQLVSEAYDYEQLAKPAETGSVSVRGSRLYCTPEGQTKAQIIGYELKDGKLRLNFADAIQVYEKVN